MTDLTERLKRLRDDKEIFVGRYFLSKRYRNTLTEAIERIEQLDRLLGYAYEREDEALRERDEWRRRANQAAKKVVDRERRRETSP